MPLAQEKYKYEYQGQEHQTELGLNWSSFKYRNYDYAIGRFLSVDPLAGKYPHNSTYAFQENKMGLGRELEGLELAPFFGFSDFITLEDSSKFIEISNEENFLQRTSSEDLSAETTETTETETTKNTNNKPKQLKKDRYKSHNDYEKKTNQLRDIEKAKETAKKLKPGEKQNKIFETKKSLQNAKKAWKEIDIDNLDDYKYYNIQYMIQTRDVIPNSN